MQRSGFTAMPESNNPGTASPYLSAVVAKENSPCCHLGHSATLPAAARPTKARRTAYRSRHFGPPESALIALCQHRAPGNDRDRARAIRQVRASLRLLSVNNRFSSRDRQGTSAINDVVDTAVVRVPGPADTAPAVRAPDGTYLSAKTPGARFLRFTQSHAYRGG